MRYRPIDSIRGLFALMIVWHHICPLLGIPYHYDFGNTIVLFFFILSGFHIALGWKDRIEGHTKDFIMRRCKKIFPIQWLMTILFVVCGINVVSLWTVPFHLTLTQSLIPLWKINFTLNTPSWFLSSIFICYLIAPLLIKWAKNYRARFILFYFVALLGFSLFVFLLPDSIGHRWLVYINPFARILDFSIGIILGVIWNNERIYHKYESISRINYGIIELILIVAVVSFMVCRPLNSFNDYTFIRYPALVAFIVVFTLSKGFISKLLSNRLFTWLGKISMSIYMTHTFILAFVQKIDIDLSIKIILSYLLTLLMSVIVEKVLGFIPILNKRNK